MSDPIVLATYLELRIRSSNVQIFKYHSSTELSFALFSSRWNLLDARITGKITMRQAYAKIDEQSLWAEINGHYLPKFQHFILQKFEARKNGQMVARFLCFSLGHRSNDVRIARVRDGKGADPEVLSTGGSKLNVVASVVVNTSLGQHGIVLNLWLPATSKLK